MNSHENARLTPHGRAGPVRRMLEEGQTVGRMAKAFGVPATTVRKWVGRYRREETQGCATARPARTGSLRPCRLTRFARSRRCAAGRWTGKRVALALGLSPARVSRVSRRLGPSRMRDLIPPNPCAAMSANGPAN